MLHLKTPSNRLLSDHPFWQFSCEIYKHAKDSLLEMQAHHGLNINVILFCYWYSANYQKSLSKNDIKQLLTVIHKWHQNTVHPLRALRNDLKARTDLDWANKIRREVLEAELMAERVEQTFIVDLFAKYGRHVKNPNTQKAILYAFRSIKFYCEVLYITLNDQDCADFIHVAQCIFPDVKPDTVNTLGRRILKRTPNASVSKQRINMELFRE
jgi:uncharacterized protein (TIGR02444 family)